MPRATAIIPAGVGPVAAVEERVAGRGDDLRRVFGVLLGGVGGAGEGLGQLVLDLFGDLCGLRRGGDLGGEAGGVAGGQQGAEDRLHDRAAEVALEVGGAGGHAGAGDRHRAGQRARGGGAGEADADPDQQVAEPDHQVGGALVPEHQHLEEGEQAEDEAEQQREAGAVRLRPASPSAGRRRSSPAPPAGSPAPASRVE